MGVKSDLILITEGKNPVEEILDSAISFFTKKIPTTIKATDPEVMVGLVRVPRATFYKLTKFLTTKDWTELTDSEAAFLGQVLSQDSNYVNSLYQQEFRKVMAKYNLSETDLIKKMNQELPDPYTSADILNYLATKFQNPADPSSIKPSFTLSGIVGSKIKNKITELQNTGKVKEEIASAEGLVKRVGKNVMPPVIIAFRQILTGAFTSNKKLEEQLDDIFKKIDAKLAEGGGKVSTTKVNREVREIFNILVAMKKSADFNIKKLYEYHILENSKIPEEVKQELIKEKYVEKIIKYADEDLANSTMPIIMRKAQNYVESIPILGGLIRGLAKKAMYKEEYKFLESMLAEQVVSLKRLGNVIIWNSPQGLEDVIVNYSRTGKWATLVEKAAGYLFVHNYLVPFALQTIEGWRTNSEIIKIREEIKAYLELCQDGVLDLQCPEEDIKNFRNYSRDQFWKAFFNKVPILKPFREGFQGTDPLFFTYVDEILNFLGDAFDGELFGDQQTVKNLIDKTQALRDRYREQLKLQGVDIDNLQNYEEFRERQNKTYDNSENGFKEYVKDNFTTVDTSGLNLKLTNGNYQFFDEEFEWVKERGMSNKGKFRVKNAQ